MKFDFRVQAKGFLFSFGEKPERKDVKGNEEVKGGKEGDGNKIEREVFLSLSIDWGEKNPPAEESEANIMCVCVREREREREREVRFLVSWQKKKSIYVCIEKKAVFFF